MPITDLFVLEGSMNGIRVDVLKDDGCNTNVISREFAKRNEHRLRFVSRKMSVAHSSKNTDEVATRVAVGATLMIGRHEYKSNWIITDARYDVILGMPWHKQCNPTIHYDKRVVEVDGVELPIVPMDEKVPKISNMSVKKFRSLLRKKRHKENFEVFQVVRINNQRTQTGVEIDNAEVSDDVRQKQQKIDAMLEKYKAVFSNELPDGLPPERSVEPAIKTDPNAKPPYRPLFQLSPAELLATKEYIEDLLKKGKIRRSSSPYGAPLFFVRQKGGKLRGVIDYRALNRITKRDSTPIPRTDEMFDRLGRARYFSKMDLKSGFHQIRVKASDVEKTAFTTKYGQFEFLVMPMGLCNAPASFQSLMNTIFHDCIDVFLVVYLDDLLIFSRTLDDHMKHLDIVLQRLQQHELYVGPSKCEFLKQDIEFLGLRVGTQGIKVGEDRIQEVKNWPTPKSLTEVRGFAGLLQFFRRFIRDFSKIAAPLTNLTKKNSGIHNWDNTCDAAFEKLKTALTTAPILVAPNWEKPFIGHIDACQISVGGTLTQAADDGHERVVAYFSKRLSKTEQNYSANDRELLGLVYFLKRFRCYLEGSTFQIVTDNQVLKHLFTKPNLSRREARYIDFLSQFNISKMTLKKGVIHVLGDALSRIPLDERTVRLSNLEMLKIEAPKDIRLNYEKDPVFGPLVHGFRGEFSSDTVHSSRVRHLMSRFSMNNGLIYYDEKLCVPRANIKEILALAHDSRTSGHFGADKTIARLSGFHWKNMTSVVREYCAGCFVCQQQKNRRTKKLGSSQALEIPNRRWGSISTDFITHLPKTKNGHDAITTYVDRLSKRVHFIASKSTDSAKDVAQAFHFHVFKHHGLPDSIVSDRDPKFTSNFWRELTALLGIRLQMSTSHHPQTDGLAEVMNRLIGNYLRCFVNRRRDDWDVLLPGAEFAYNSSKLSNAQFTPFELDLG